MSYQLRKHHVLPNGYKMPVIAMGTAAPGENIVQTVKYALSVGYRHFDTAWIYENSEEQIGEAIRQSDVSRKDIFITSKLWNAFHAAEDVEPTLDESLARLGTNYVDLYLIHWPIAFKKNTGEDIVVDSELTSNPYVAWKRLEELVDKGKIRNIGISNFTIARYEELMSHPLKYKPSVHQIEVNYFFPQPKMLEYFTKRDVAVAAYCPMGSPERVKEALAVKEIKDAAQQLGITAAQVVLSWLVQRGAVALPKSSNPSRIKENLQVQALPNALFTNIESSALAHPPERLVDPSEEWGIKIFDD